MKTDVRSEYTKNVIENALFELLESTPLKKITVKAICEKAGINRSTFYRYYDDPYALMYSCEELLLKEFSKYSALAAEIGTQAAIECMLKAVQKNERLYCILSSQNADDQYIQWMIDNGYKQFEQGFKRRFPNLSPLQRKWLFYYTSQGTIEVTQQWIKDGMQESTKKTAEFIAGITDRALAMHTFKTV